MRKLLSTYLSILISSLSFGQMGHNSCVFKIFYDDIKILTVVDTLSFLIYNDHSFQKKIMYKDAFPYSSFPDSCWILHTEEDQKNQFEFPNEEDVVYHPNLTIIRKATKDTMRIHYNYLVYPFEEGTLIPIVNEIIFTPGSFEVYETTIKKDWVDYSTSKKIKQKNNVLKETSDSIGSLKFDCNEITPGAYHVASGTCANLVLNKDGTCHFKKTSHKKKIVGTWKVSHCTLFLSFDAVRKKSPLESVVGKNGKQVKKVKYQMTMTYKIQNDTLVAKEKYEETYNCGVYTLQKQ